MPINAPMGDKLIKRSKVLKLPDAIPEWVHTASISPYTTANTNSALSLYDVTNLEGI